MTVLHPLTNISAMPSPYKLSATLQAHTQDVRCVASTSASASLPRVLSSSRDKTARIWSTSTSSKEWSCSRTLEGHEGFVNAVCSAKLSDGREYAVTAGQDATIVLWDADSGEMKKVLVGHTSNVCALDARDGYLASASWDK
jgi:phospholipase A-2-activating protein